MLTPEQVAGLSDDVVALLRDLDIALTEEAARLVAQGASADTVRASLNRVAATYPLAVDTVTAATIRSAALSLAKSNEALFATAKAAGIIGDYASLADSIAVRNVLTSSIRTGQAYARFTMTSALEARTATAIQALDSAALKAATGVMTREQATAEAVKTIGRTATKFTYRTPSGVITRELDSAVRSLVGTTAHQAALRVQEVRLQEVGAEFVEVSQHFGARPDHEVWQGQVYAYPEEFETATDYGSVTGLAGVSCRHSYAPYFPGISTPLPPKLDTAQNNEVYEASQRQRQIERTLREYRRRDAATRAALEVDPTNALLKRDADKNRDLIAKWQGEARANSKATGIPRRYAAEKPLS